VIAPRSALPLSLVALMGCSRHAPSLSPPSWTQLQPGLWTSEFAVAGGARAYGLRFDQSLFALSLTWSPAGMRVPDARPDDAVAIWNGGYFERDLRPSGLLIDQGRQAAPPNNGKALIVFGDGTEGMRLVRYRERSDPSDSVKSALQVWPFLVEPGGSAGIRRDDQKKAHRSAIGLDADARGLLLAVVDDGVSLYELMGIVQTLGAVVAANLDGGPSTGFGLRPAPAWSFPSQTLISNALVLRALTPSSERR
jgi:hypothetical protein